MSRSRAPQDGTPEQRTEQRTEQWTAEREEGVWGGAGTRDACPARTGPRRVRLHGPGFAADPFRRYEHLRSLGPVAPVEIAPGVEVLLVTSYEAALTVLRDSGTFVKDSRRWSALKRGELPMDSPVLPVMAWRPSVLFADGTSHSRLRASMTDGLARLDPHVLRGYVEQSAGVLIDRFVETGEVDLVRDFAGPLPLLVFTHLFGCPEEFGGLMVAGAAGMIDAEDAHSEQASEELLACLTELVALKRGRPDADLTSWLLSHHTGLSDSETLHQLVVLVGAGSIPQSAWIANALRLLLTDDRFAGSLSGGSMPVADALEEVLWTEAPMSNFSAHYAVREVDLAGVTVPPGVPLLISHAAANTDPRVADGRRGGNRAHLAFSAGPHRCPAQEASTLIATVSIETLLDRVPDMYLTVPVEEVPWRPGPFHRAPAALPVRFPPVPAPPSGGETPGDPVWNTRLTPSSSAAPEPAEAPADSEVPVPVPAPRGRRGAGWNPLSRWRREG